MSLFATKPLDRILSESEGGRHTLKRSLGALSLVAPGIGAGLFSLTGLAAARNAGPPVVLSCVVAAIGCASAGMC
jgi:APA family basic amino acid/polyamine antiporter